MFSTAAPGPRLRFATYGAILGFVLWAAAAGALAPRTRFQELSARADEGWALPTATELFRPVATTSLGFETGPDVDRPDVDRMEGGGSYQDMSWRPGLGPIGTMVLLFWVVVGSWGWLASCRWARTR